MPKSKNRKDHKKKVAMRNQNIRFKKNQYNKAIQNLFKVQSEMEAAAKAEAAAKENIAENSQIEEIVREVSATTPF